MWLSITGTFTWPFPKLPLINPLSISTKMLEWPTMTAMHMARIRKRHPPSIKNSLWVQYTIFYLLTLSFIASLTGVVAYIVTTSRKSTDRIVNRKKQRMWMIWACGLSRRERALHILLPHVGLISVLDLHCVYILYVSCQNVTSKQYLTRMQTDQYYWVWGVWDIREHSKTPLYLLHFQFLRYILDILHMKYKSKCINGTYLRWTLLKFFGWFASHD